MIRLLALVSAVILVMLVMIVVMRQLGTQREDLLASMLSRGSTAYPQACWYAICPQRVSRQMSVKVLTEIAKTNAAQIIYKPILTDDGDSVSYDGCATFMLLRWRICVGGYLLSDERNVFVRINLINRNVSLSDIIARLGTPSSASLCAGSIAIQPGVGIAVIKAYIYYKNGITISAFKPSKYNLSIYPIPPDEWRVSGDMKVYEIVFFHATPYTAIVTNDPNDPAFRWHGFTEGAASQYSCAN